MIGERSHSSLLSSRKIWLERRKIMNKSNQKYFNYLLGGALVLVGGATVFDVGAEPDVVEEPDVG